MRGGQGGPWLEQIGPAARFAPRSRVGRLPETQLGGVRHPHHGCRRNLSGMAGGRLLCPCEGALCPDSSVGTVWFSLVLTQDKGLWFELQPLQDLTRTVRALRAFRAPFQEHEQSQGIGTGYLGQSLIV